MIDIIDEDVVMEASVPDIPGVKERIAVTSIRRPITEIEVGTLYEQSGHGSGLH